MHETTGSSMNLEAADAVMKDGDPHKPAQRSRQGSSSPSRTAGGGAQSSADIPSKKMASETREGPGRGSGAQPAPASATAKKKKGTASIVKASKRGKGGARKPRAASKKTKRASADANADADADAAGDTGDGEESDESDSGPYCICRGPDNHRFMIACDQCEDWFHGDCIGMDKYTGENLVQRYICPNCTDGKMYVTRYKKTCSLEGCEKPARIYDPKVASIFCGDDHCQAWWEQLIATLPRSRAGYHGDLLTQEDFMGLVHGSARKPGDQDRTWKLGDDPFGVPPDFWDTTDPQEVLSSEEQAFLSRSAQHRHGLGEEIVLCKKMLQLIDMAARRRDAAVAASASLGKGHALGKDFCGYDGRLDAVGATHAFAAFVRSPAGEAVFRAGKLDAPPPPPDSPAADHPAAGSKDKDKDASDPPAAAAMAAMTAGMCAKKKCKPHLQWAGMLSKATKHQIKELAAQAKEILDAEARVRDGAAVRHRRRLRENNWVTAVGGEDSGSEMDVD